ncbi:MAG: FAD-binding domain-containing protein [Pseudohongiellaceae bacterium]
MVTTFDFSPPDKPTSIGTHTYKDEASKEVHAFLKGPVLEYSKKRNFDFGYSENRHVSKLSKYVSHRIVSEYDLIRNALCKHEYHKVEKFIQEIFWRIYWKGWLEMRPEVWTDFIDLPTSDNSINFEAALKGNTGVKCFDSWVRELRETNYLHNHARMWFASIWIFTLELPWQLGARFFLEHLADGDAASNTLSWRWVAGLQTKGKRYKASSHNIETYTKGRFKEILVNENPKLELEYKNYPITRKIPAANEKKQHENLLIFENDLNFNGREELYNSYKNIFVATLPNDARHIKLSSSIIEYKKDLVAQFCEFFPNSTILSSDLESTISSNNKFDIVYPFVGENLTFLERLKSRTSIEYSYLFRHEDHISMQYCQKGFFQFKKNIPKILESLLC